MFDLAGFANIPFLQPSLMMDHSKILFTCG